MPKTEPIIFPYRGVYPRIHPTAFIAPGAAIIGDVQIGPESSVWFGCVIRGDRNKVRIGARTNIQDGSIIHVSTDLQTALTEGHYPAKGYPTLIGDDITIGHKATIHACTIKSGAFIGMGSILLDGSDVEEDSVLAAGALLASGKKVASGELWMGSPAKFSRKLSLEELKEFRSRSGEYVSIAQEYKKDLEL